MKNCRFFVGISLLVFILSYGCGVENSEKEMKEAQAAMDQAKGIFAEDLAPSNYMEAMQAWEQGQAAVKEGKPAKTYFLRAKSRFEKTMTIAKAQGEALSKEITDMQLSIATRFDKVRAGLESGRTSLKIKEQLKPLAAEAEEAKAAVDSMASQGNYVKAFKLAKELQTKLYNAELILAGKKPAAQ